MKKKVIYITILIFVANSFARSQTFNISELDGRVNTITTAVPFLSIAPNSRAGGMGDVGVATSPDANSQHWNAAKYVFIKKDFGVSISYTPWLRELVNDISISYISGYKRINKFSAVAASLRYFSLGNITFRNRSGRELRAFNPNEFAFDVSYSMLLTDGLSGAVTLRAIYSNLTGGISSGGGSDTHPGRAVAGDLALFYTKDITLNGQPSVMSFGLQISNIGSKVSYTDESESDFIPTNLKLGGSLNYSFDKYNSLTVSIDMNKLLVPTQPVYDVEGNIIAGKDPNVSVPTGILQSFVDAPAGMKEEWREVNLSGGIEYWYNQRFALRAGYFHEHATKGNRKFYTMGLGLKLNAFQLDFAYLLAKQNNPLQNTLRFSLLFDFEGMRGGKEKVKDEE